MLSLTSPRHISTLPTPGRSTKIVYAETVTHPTCHHHPRHFWIEPADAVGANDEIGWIKNVTLDEIKHGKTMLDDQRPRKLAQATLASLKTTRIGTWGRHCPRVNSIRIKFYPCIR